MSIFLYGASERKPYVDFRRVLIVPPNCDNFTGPAGFSFFAARLKFPGRSNLDGNSLQRAIQTKPLLGYAILNYYNTSEKALLKEGENVTCWSSIPFLTGAKKLGSLQQDMKAKTGGYWCRTQVFRMSNQDPKPRFFSSSHMNEWHKHTMYRTQYSRHVSRILSEGSWHELKRKVG